MANVKDEMQAFCEKLPKKGKDVISEYKDEISLFLAKNYKIRDILKFAKDKGYKGTYKKFIDILHELGLRAKADASRKHEDYKIVDNMKIHFEIALSNGATVAELYKEARNAGFTGCYHKFNNILQEFGSRKKQSKEQKKAEDLEIGQSNREIVNKQKDLIKLSLSKGHTVANIYKSLKEDGFQGTYLQLINILQEFGLRARKKKASVEEIHKKNVAVINKLEDEITMAISKKANLSDIFKFVKKAGFSSEYKKFAGLLREMGFISAETSNKQADKPKAANSTDNVKVAVEENACDKNNSFSKYFGAIARIFPIFNKNV